MHDEWQSFLTQQSANVVDGLVNDFGNPQTEHLHANAENIITDLSNLNVLEVSGKDSGEFLHGQLSSDVAALAEHEMQLSSWCNIKGRVIASFLLYRSHDCFYLLLDKDLSDSVTKRLQMFVLRAEVSVSDRSDELIRIGIRGESLHKQVQQILDTDPSEAAGILLRLQDTIPRSIILCSLDHAIYLWQQLSAQGNCVGTHHWARYNIEAGIAWVGKAGSEEFLPQSLNLDLLGGLSFEKGCYPGQEIIARMHFRGKLKQRLFLSTVAVNEPAATGSKLYTVDVKQRIGMVVNASPASDQGCIMLVVLELAYADNVHIHLGAEDGPALELHALPYSLDS
ncbi:MAG: hypothetical protein O6945_13240 [Gammaproteobacteria bacterium]|nr:hypothetical protein [Gammaproteobacteria bacterium]